jgi:hypothetical protein
MGVKALVYFEIVTTAALFILAVVNFTKLGAGVTLAATSTDVIKTIEQGHPKTLVETIVHAFPKRLEVSTGRFEIICSNVSLEIAESFVLRYAPMLYCTYTQS